MYLLLRTKKIEIKPYKNNIKIRYKNEGRGGSNSRWLNIPKEIQIKSNLIQALGIYYAEGDKSKTRWHTRFSNSETVVVNYGLELFKVFGIGPHKLNGYIKTYNQKIPDKQLINYWSCATRMPKENFFKIFNSRSRAIYKRNRGLPSKHGRLEVQFSSVVVRDMVDNLSKEIKYLCLKNNNIAIDFLKGLFAGDGSVKLFNNKLREVRNCFMF